VTAATGTVARTASALRARILDGALAPGSPLREVELARSLGVARHTLRAALLVLAHDGLVVREPNRGARVATLGPDDIRDLFRLRAAIEGEAARILAGQAEPASAQNALQALAALPADAPWSAVADAHAAFHHALVAAAGSPRLVRAHETIDGELRLYVTGLRGAYGTAGSLVPQHRDLLRAIAAGTPADAAAAMRAHLEATLPDLLGAASAAAVREPAATAAP